MKGGKAEIVLVPLLSRSENDSAFLELIAEKTEEAVLLVVIDTDSMLGGFGFAASDIRKGSDLMEQMGKALREKRVLVDDVLEWGDTATKIEHLAKLKKAEKVLLKRQENHYFEKLVEELEERKVKVEVV